MRPPINGTLELTQLFGGNPASEAYQTADGFTVIGHSGIDIAAPEGTPVYPAWDGRLTVIDSGGSGFGLHAIVSDSRGRKALYGHLSRVDVGDGGQVWAHQPFAVSGSTGFSTGPHIHFEIHESPDDLGNGYYGARDPLGGFDHDVLPHLDLHISNL